MQPCVSPLFLSLPSVASTSDRRPLRPLRPPTQHRLPALLARLVAADWERRLDRVSRLAAGPRAPPSWVITRQAATPPRAAASSSGTRAVDSSSGTGRSRARKSDEGEGAPVRAMPAAARATLQRYLLRRAGGCAVPSLRDLCAVAVATRTAELGVAPAEALAAVAGEAQSVVVAVGLRCAPVPAALLQRVRAAPEFRERLSLEGARLSEDDLRLILAPDEGRERAILEDRAWRCSKAGRRARRLRRLQRERLQRAHDAAPAPTATVSPHDATAADRPASAAASASAAISAAEAAADDSAGSLAPESWEHWDDGPGAAPMQQLPAALADVYAPSTFTAHLHTINLSGCRSLQGGGAFTGLLVSYAPRLRRLYLDDAFATPRGAQATLSALAHASLPLLSHLDMSHNRLLVDKDLEALQCPQVLPCLHSFVAVGCPLLTPQRVRSLLYFRSSVRHAITLSEERDCLLQLCARECSAQHFLAQPSAVLGRRRPDPADEDW